MHATNRLTQLDAVSSGNATTVENPGALRNLGRYSFSQESSDVGMGLLGLGSSSNFSCPNGPHGLIRNNDFARDIV